MRSLLRPATIVALMCMTVATAISCGGSEAEPGAQTETEGDQVETKTVTILLNWFPQMEQGGYFQAAVQDLGRDEGINIELLPGGPQVQTISQVASGQVDYGLARSDQIFFARSEGVPVVMVFANLNRVPSCMMFHPETGIEEPADIDGHPVAVAPGGAFWPWMKREFGLDNVREVSFTGQLSEFARNEDLVQQCFMTNEPLVADQENISHEEFLIADLGYDPYIGLFTTEDKIRNDPDEVRAVVAAAKEGWDAMAEDPSTARDAVLDANDELDPLIVEDAADIIVDQFLADDIGPMEEERWQVLYEQMVSVAAIPEGLDVTEAYTNEFLP